MHTISMLRVGRLSNVSWTGILYVTMAMTLLGRMLNARMSEVGIDVLSFSSEGLARTELTV